MGFDYAMLLVFSIVIIVALKKYWGEICKRNLYTFEIFYTIIYSKEEKKEKKIFYNKIIFSAISQT